MRLKWKANFWAKPTGGVLFLPRSLKDTCSTYVRFLHVFSKFKCYALISSGHMKTSFVGVPIYNLQLRLAFIHSQLCTEMHEEPFRNSSPQSLNSSLYFWFFPTESPDSWVVCCTARDNWNRIWYLKIWYQCKKTEKIWHWFWDWVMWISLVGL